MYGRGVFIYLFILLLFIYFFFFCKFSGARCVRVGWGGGRGGGVQFSEVEGGIAFRIQYSGKQAWTNSTYPEQALYCLSLGHIYS